MTESQKKEKKAEPKTKSDVISTNNETKTKDKTEPAIDPQILEDLPPELQKQVALMISSSRYQGPMPNPLVEKLNEEHISKIIDASIADDEKNYKFAIIGRRYTLIYVILGVIAFFCLLLFLIDRNPELLKDILKMGGAFIGGGAGGYGLRAYKDSRQK
jgi:hypothetical protein